MWNSCGDTSKTLSSLGVTPGKELLVADNADEFSQTVLGLLDDSAQRSEVGLAGAKYVNMWHSLNVIAKQMVGYYSETVSGR